MLRMTFPSPVGPLTLFEEEGVLVELRFGDFGEADVSELLERARCQIAEYFSGVRRTFDLPLAPAGTPFRQRVWQALLAIPYGECRSYGAVAAAVGQPKASRAVGMANRCNPLPILIPCHRVVGANGRLTGYAGGLDKKELLLNLERNVSSFRSPESGRREEDGL